jgi:hypothetical protein
MHWPHAIVCRAFPSLKFLKACPAMDLVLRNANLPDGRTGIDIGIQDGRGWRRRGGTRSTRPAGW